MYAVDEFRVMFILDDSLNKTMEMISIIDLTETDDEGSPVQKKQLAVNKNLHNIVINNNLNTNMFKLVQEPP